MNVNRYIDIERTEEDVKKIIAEFINKKYGGTINVDQYDIEIHVGMRERNFTEEPCFEDAVVHYRFGAGSEDKRMKTDIMEYVEKIWSAAPLTNSQKEFLRDAYEAADNNMQFIYCSPRNQNRSYLITLMALATILIAEERGVLKITDRQYSKTPIIIGRNSFRKE